MIEYHNEAVTSEGVWVMAHTLVLVLPEDVFKSIVETARETGQSPEALAATWLANAARRTEEDPLEKWIGAISSDVRGWADEHDKYIGAQLADSMHSSESDDSSDG